MKVQTNLNGNANYHLKQSFTANRFKLKDFKPIAGITTVCSRKLSAVPSKGDYAQFAKDFEAIYRDYNKACWEYVTTNNVWAGLKSYIGNFKYNKFINKKENRENYIKLYGRQDIKFKNNFECFTDFLKRLPIDIFYHSARKKVLKASGTIDGKKVSQAQIYKIILNEQNPILRKKAWNEKFKIGDSLKNYVIGIIKKRNSTARTLKQDSYFNIILNNYYQTDAKTFRNNLDKEYVTLKPELERILEENNDRLKKIFKTNQLEYYHYNLRVGSEEYNILDEAVAKYGTISLAKNIYSKIGFDLDKLTEEGKLIFYEDKSKKRSFHRAIVPGKLSGICVGMTNDFYNLLTLCHELGHAMYNLGFSESLPLSMKKSPSIAMNEAVATMMADIVLNENMLTDIVPADILEKVKNYRHSEKLINIARNLAITEFEQEMYSNPKQDLAKLWQDKLKQFTGRDYTASNEWATMDNFINCPARVHDYITATFIAAQLYKHLKGQLGNLADNKDTAKYLNENIFSKGASVGEAELIKEITGKELSLEDFINGI